MSFTWTTIKECIQLFGLKEGLFILFFFIAHGWVYLQYAGRLRDRQKEIDRLAQDNREYRDRWLNYMDKKQSYTPYFKKTDNDDTNSIEE